jgi:hypothetical protein
MKFSTLVLFAAAASSAVASPAKEQKKKASVFQCWFLIGNIGFKDADMLQGSEAMSLEPSLAKIPFLALMYVVIDYKEVYSC